MMSSGALTGRNVVMLRLRVGRTGSTEGADAEVPAIGVSIVLPHDGIISTLFFGCWARGTHGYRAQRGVRKFNGAVDAECKGLLTKLNDMVNKVIARVRPYEFRYIATFGNKVANDVDISKVCFDYGFDDVVRNDSNIESRVPAYIEEDISRVHVHLTFDRYVKDVVRTPVILSVDEYIQAMRESFKATDARIRRIT